jgi:hypothetical protein
VSSVQRLLGRALTSLVALVLVFGSLTAVSPALAEEPTPAPTEAVVAEETPTPEESPAPPESPAPTDAPDPAGTEPPAETPVPTETPVLDGQPSPEPTGEAGYEVPLRHRDLGFDSIEGTGSISGVVIEPDGDPAIDVQVVLYLGDDESGLWWGGPNEDGEWSFDGLDSGDYRVQFYYFGEENIASEWWADAQDFQSATVIELSEGGLVAGLETALVVGATISGDLSGANGPLETGDVTVYDQNSGWVGFASTNPDGTWTVDGLAAGSYKVGFQDQATGGGHLPEYWDDAQDFFDADNIALATAENRTGVDAVLTLGAQLSGVVTDGTDPVADIKVEVIDSQSSSPYWVLAEAHTAADGTWSVGGAGSRVVHREIRGRIRSRRLRAAVV